MTTTEQLVLADGRKLAYAIYGVTETSSSARGMPTVFYFHGYPGSHYEAGTFDAAAKARGVRVVAASRPGMGGSTYQADRRLLDWPADVLAVADHLKVDRFAVMGVSGGGPYVLACWHALSKTKRLVGAGLVGGLYPTSLGTAGMLFELRALLAVAPWIPGLVGMGMDYAMGKLARDDEHPEKFEEALAQGLKDRPAPDVAVFGSNEGGAREALVKSTREAFRDGGRGASSWGFEFQDLDIAEKGTLIMWYGSADANILLRISEGEAHLSLVPAKADEILSTLSDMLKR
ncbi:putative alpha beta hydrolase [Diplogelasinospora grovesii]|uniref:Alpha beta hydrolase n=1 Tax=Diplogelasinospora grovesii TaxID=303347 RepID=A0AAN6S408_9PEZI|nr:putative alpha beta hydrolase [Diplogelasinospora grovesii]